MEQATPVEQYETKVVNCSDIVLREGHRRPSPQNVEEIVRSFKDVGQLQPIGVVAQKGNSGYILIWGGNRLAAAKKLKQDGIWARVLLIEPTDADAIMHAENLFRTNMSTKERMAAVATWAEWYKAKYPQSFNQGVRRKQNSDTDAAAVETKPSDSLDTVSKDGLTVGDAIDFDRERSGSRAVGNTAPPVVEVKAKREKVKPERVIAEPIPDRPDEALAKLTGQSPRNSRRELKIAETLSAEQIGALTEKGAGPVRLMQVARLPTEEKRTKAVALIASGMDVDTAIVMATSPDNATLKIVEGVQADGFKPEDQLTDDEWFDGYCGETLRKIKNHDVYKSNALLYRHMRAASVEFRLKGHKILGKVKAADRGPIYRTYIRTMTIAHPKDWQHCGRCNGTGWGTDAKCDFCRGDGFTVTTEQV